MREGRIKLCPFWCARCPYYCGGSDEIRVIKRARPNPHRLTSWFNGPTIHLRAASRAKTALNAVPAICGQTDGGQRPFVAHGFFRKQHIDRRRTTRNPLTIPTPAKARTNGFSINAKADRAAEALAGVGHRPIRSAAP